MGAKSELFGGEVDFVGGEMGGQPIERIIGVLVAFDLFRDLPRWGFFAEPIGDISRMAERAGDVAVENLSMEIGGFSAAHRMEKIGVVAS